MTGIYYTVTAVESHLGGPPYPVILCKGGNGRSGFIFYQLMGFPHKFASREEALEAANKASVEVAGYEDDLIQVAKHGWDGRVPKIMTYKEDPPSFPT